MLQIGQTLLNHAGDRNDHRSERHNGVISIELF
jgi:hypothetical protein